MNIAGITNPAGLEPWYDRLRNRSVRQAGVVLVGDSTTESFGATTWANRVPQQLDALLRAQHPTSGVFAVPSGYVPVKTVAGPTPPVTTSGGPTDSSIGLGLKGVVVNSSKYVEWTATCDRVAVWYATAATLAGNGIVSIDAVDQATLTGLGASYIDGRRWLSGALSYGSHTVRVRGAGAFGFPVYGVQFFAGDHDKGVQVYDAAHFGWSSDNYSTGLYQRHWQAVAGTVPGVVVINLGINDWSYRTPAAYLANIDTMLGELATQMGSIPHSVLLVFPYRPVRNFATVASEWEEMRAGIVARATGNRAVLQLQPPWPDLYPNVANSLMYETDYPLHPNNAGCAAYADLLAQALRLPDTRETQPTATRLTAGSKASLP